LTELKNLREENRNLSQELKALLTEPEPESLSVENESSQSPTLASVTTITVADPESAAPEGQTKPKRKRIVI
jgi:hypothetical protein